MISLVVRPLPCRDDQPDEEAETGGGRRGRTQEEGGTGQVRIFYYYVFYYYAFYYSSNFYSSLLQGQYPGQAASQGSPGDGGEQTCLL